MSTVQINSAYVETQDKNWIKNLEYTKLIDKWDQQFTKQKRYYNAYTMNMPK